MTHKANSWQTLSSEIAHKNPYFSVRKDSIVKPDGSEGVYYVIDVKGAAFIVPLDDELNVYLFGMDRYPNNNYSIEVPGGGLDGQDPLIAAKRELQEETGLEAKTWKHLGVTHPLNGVASEKNHMFLATDLVTKNINMQKNEGVIKTIKVPLKRALEMIKNGEITDQQTISALTLAALEIGL